MSGLFTVHQRNRVLIENAMRLGLICMVVALTSLSVSSREGGSSMLVFSVAMSSDVSFREQQINQTILQSLVLEAGRLADVAPCGLNRPFQTVYRFGEFAVSVRHPNPAMQVKCLRGVVRYLLHEDIVEADFVAARAFEARTAPDWIKPKPNDPERAQDEAERLAFLAIYQTNSPLYQLHSVDLDAIAATSLDDFALWMERNRKATRFSFGGPRGLLEALGLPVPDPMLLQPVASLASSRVPAGVLAFDGERVEVPGLIMLFLGHDQKTPLNDKVRTRFACGLNGPPDLGDDYSAIARASCRTENQFGDTWFELGLRKAESASTAEFCRQVRALSRDDDVTTAVRFSPDGSKGFYVLLPPACKEPE